MHSPHEAHNTGSQMMGAPTVASSSANKGTAVSKQKRRLASEMSSSSLEELFRRSIYGLGISTMEIFDLLPIGVQIDNAEHRTIYINSCFREMFGYALDDIADLDDWYRNAYPDPVERAAIRDNWAARLAHAEATGQQVPPVERRVTCKNGEKKVVEFFVRRIGDHYIYLNTDVSDRSRLMVEVSRLAYTDALTGLGNRRSFFAEAEALFMRRPETVAGLMVDVDHFKSVNDRFGHKTGDDVLVYIATRCRAVIGENGHFARLGGEEFGLLLPEHNHAAALELAEDMRRAVAAAPYFVADHGLQLTLTISIGGAVARLGNGGVDALMVRADRALYDAKQSGRNRVRFGEG